MTVLVLEDIVNAQRHVVDVGRVLVVGFAGRDAKAVADHVDELAALGVPRPASTPTFYELGAESVRQTPVLTVEGADTSGEIEPVIVVSDGMLLLTAGSDHTDRTIERRDIAASKAACTKVVASNCIPVDAIEDWDSIEISSAVGPEVEPYQHGTLAELLPLEEILDGLSADRNLTPRDGDVIFLGTVPTLGEIRPAETFAGSLNVPSMSKPIAFEYRTVDLSGTGRPPSRKPEYEFFPVDTVEWTRIPGGADGQTERILSSDPATGVATRMLRFEPGTDTSHLGVFRHDFWEEVYILDGELHDLTLDRVFRAGTYACRPPGMPHGPWTSETGCVTFEVRYPAV